MSRNKNLDQRDRKTGRFLTGNAGGGRPVGNRNRLSERFLEDLRKEWEANGQAALARVAAQFPDVFCKIVANLLPRELEAEITTNVNLFARVENVNTAYKLALDYINGKIADDDEGRLIETNNGQR